MRHRCRHGENAEPQSPTMDMMDTVQTNSAIDDLLLSIQTPGLTRLPVGSCWDAGRTVIPAKDLVRKIKETGACQNVQAQGQPPF